VSSLNKILYNAPKVEDNYLKSIFEHFRVEKYTLGLFSAWYCIVSLAESEQQITLY